MRTKFKPHFAALALLFSAITAIIVWKSEARTADSLPAAEVHAYAPVLIIDAGHGGLDGGAVSVTGRCESEINLAIATKIEDLADLFGAEHIMTRTSETLDYPESADSIRDKKLWDQKQRVQLINEADHGILISVHQNTYPDPRPCGAEVYYGTADGSDRLATQTQQNLVQFLCPENRRVAAPISKKIYLLRQVSCPAILVECGFLSNAAEAAKLEHNEYQIAIAVLLMGSYFQFLAD